MGIYNVKSMDYHQTNIPIGNNLAFLFLRIKIKFEFPNLI